MVTISCTLSIFYPWNNLGHSRTGGWGRGGDAIAPHGNPSLQTRVLSLNTRFNALNPNPWQADGAATVTLAHPAEITLARHLLVLPELLQEVKPLTPNSAETN